MIQKLTSSGVSVWRGDGPLQAPPQCYPQPDLSQQFGAQLSLQDPAFLQELQRLEAGKLQYPDPVYLQQPPQQTMGPAAPLQPGLATLPLGGGSTGIPYTGASSPECTGGP